MRTMKMYFTTSLLFIYALAFPCGFEQNEESLYYHFFPQDLVTLEWYNEIDDNIKEWQQYLHNPVIHYDVAHLVYRMPVSQLQSLGTQLRQAPSQVGDSMLQNELVRHWSKGKHTGMIDYLIYAKKCEQYANAEMYYWEEDPFPDRDPEAMEELIKEGIASYEKESDTFLKQRYAYQFMRMARYKEEYERATQLFDQYIEPLRPKNYIYYRALEQKAGAMKKTGDDRAAYLFSLVFDHAVDRRDIALKSFEFTNEEQWGQSLAYCRNDREKVVFYAMRALQTYGYDLEEMENIYAVDPSSPYLDLLLVRQINAFERELSSGDSEFTAHHHRMEENSVERMEQLIRNMLTNKRTANKDLWLLADGYISFLEKDYAGCQSRLKEISPKSAYHSTARLFDYLARLMELSSLENDAENTFIREYHVINNEEKQRNNDHTDQLMELVRYKFSHLYCEAGQPAKAFLCQNDFEYLRRNLDMELLDDMEKLLNQPDYNEMEKLLILNLRGRSIHDIAELKGTYHLQRNELTEAVKEYQRLPADYYDEYYTNEEFMNASLFAAPIKYYYSTSITEQTDTGFYSHIGFLQKKYNKRILAETLLELQQRAKKEPENAFLYYYLLGNAWNNMSPYGYHRPVLYYYHSNGNNAYYINNGLKACEDYGEYIDYYSFWNIGNSHYDPQHAIDNFEMAVASTDDDEMKARAYYGAARATLFAHFSGVDDEYDYFYSGYNFKEESLEEHHYFDLLKEKYAHTAYVKEEIEECYYYRVYRDRK